MRLNINLASVKHEDVRKFFVRWGATLAILAGLAVLLAGLSYLKHARAKDSARQTSVLKEKIAALEKQRDQAADFENRPENRDVMLQKKYWNAQIARRLFSWTQLFNDLQKIMPRRAFLDSVQPELTQDNHLKLKLRIAGEKKEDARELVERMETSTRFHAPRIISETEEKENKPGATSHYRFEIETYYAPPPNAPVSPPAQIQRGHGNLAPGTTSKEGL